MINILRTRFATGALAATVALLSFASTAAGQTAGAYTVTNLISDGSVTAAVTDPNFINPWAISTSTNFWISANGSGYNYVVPAATGMIAFKVIVPRPNGTSNGSPTGSVFTSGSATTAFVLPNGTKASFLFSTDDGTISGWNGKLGTANALSQVVVDNSKSNASYNGLALLNTATASYLLAPNFGAAAKIEVYDTTFKPTTLPGGFTDPNIPTGYAPYGIHVINGQVWVTFAPRSSGGSYGGGAAGAYTETVGVGNGLVDVFDATGTLISRAVTAGNLNDPWGVAIAPATFGIYANDLLIGNFGDGLINVYDPKTFAYLGQLTDGTGKPFTYLSLWELLPAGTAVSNSTAVSGGTAGTVYFTAGLTNQMHGLLGAISNDTVTAGAPTFAFTTSGGNAFNVANGSAVTTTLSLAPTYNFSGATTLSCPTKPLGVTCTFSPATLSVVGTAPSTTTLTIQTTKGMAGLTLPQTVNGIAYAVLLPSMLMLMFGRRRGISGKLRLLSLVLILAGSATLFTGCSQAAPAITSTPVGAQVVTVQATSGTTTKTINLTVTVK